MVEVEPLLSSYENSFLKYEPQIKSRKKGFLSTDLYIGGSILNEYCFKDEGIDIILNQNQNFINPFGITVKIETAKVKSEHQPNDSLKKKVKNTPIKKSQSSRKIKNRISAQISRSRKKEYITELEEKVSQLKKDHKILTHNITALEAEQDTLRIELEALQNIVNQMGQNPIYKPYYDKYFRITS